MLKQAARSGKNFRSNYGKISKTEDSCQKVMAKDAPPSGHLHGNFNNPDKTFGWKSGKKSFKCHFFLFSCLKRRFYGIVFRDTLAQPVRFCPKNTKFHPSSPKKLIQNRNISLRKSFLAKFFLVVLNTGLEILTKSLAKKSEHSIKKLRIALLDC